VEPPEQVSAQVPPEQTSPAAHALSQPPQWAGSVWVLTQLWPHWVAPPPHERAHAPLEHTSPGAQGLPQLPQLVGSVWVLTQTPSQLSCPAGQPGPPVDEEDDMVPLLLDDGPLLLAVDPLLVESLVVDGLSSPEQLAAMSAAKNTLTAIHRRGSGKSVAITF
jgi:hypothetical protein